MLPMVFLATQILATCCWLPLRFASASTLVRENSELVQISIDESDLVGSGGTVVDVFQTESCTRSTYRDRCGYPGTRVHFNNDRGTYVLKGDSVVACTRTRTELFCPNCFDDECRPTVQKSYKGSTITYQVETDATTATTAVSIAALEGVDAESTCSRGGGVCTSPDDEGTIRHKEGCTEVADGWWIVPSSYSQPCAPDDERICRTLEIVEACDGVNFMKRVVGTYKLVEQPVCHESINTAYPVYRSTFLVSGKSCWIYVESGGRYNSYNRMHCKREGDNDEERQCKWTVLYYSDECASHEEQGYGDVGNMFQATFYGQADPTEGTSPEISCYDSYGENDAVRELLVRCVEYNVGEDENEGDGDGERDDNNEYGVDEDNAASSNQARLGASSGSASTTTGTKYFLFTSMMIGLIDAMTAAAAYSYVTD